MSHARRLAGLRSAELRAESRERLLMEVEGHDSAWLPLARKLERRTIPYRPDNQSRFEWLSRYVEEHPAAVWDALEAEQVKAFQWPEGDDK